jgi:hypothetical protein
VTLGCHRWSDFAASLLAEESRQPEAKTSTDPFGRDRSASGRLAYRCTGHAEHLGCFPGIDQAIATDR